MPEFDEEVPQTDEFEGVDPEPEADPEPEPPKEPSLEDRRRAALEYVRENPDFVKEFLPKAEEKVDDEDVPEFETVADMVKWVKAKAVEEASRTIQSSTGARQSFASRARSQLRSEFKDVLSESDIDDIANLYLDPNTPTAALEQSFNNGGHLHVARSKAYEVLKSNRSLEPSTGGEPVGGRSGGSIAPRARQIQESLRRQGVTIDAKTAEKYAREEVQ